MEVEAVGMLGVAEDLLGTVRVAVMDIWEVVVHRVVVVLVVGVVFLVKVMAVVDKVEVGGVECPGLEVVYLAVVVEQRVMVVDVRGVVVELRVVVAVLWVVESQVVVVSGVERAHLEESTVCAACGSTTRDRPRSCRRSTSRRRVTCPS